MKATGEFVVASWNQADLDGLWNGKRVMKVDAVFETSGGICGQILAAYLMYYAPSDTEDQHEGNAQYTGYLAFTGKVGENKGSFMLEDRGVYANSAPSSVFSIVGGSGTGELADISGGGRYYAQEGKMVFEVEYALQ